MGKRFTVVLDDEVMKKLYKIQSEEIKKSPKQISFSKVVNDALRKNIK